MSNPVLDEIPDACLSDDMRERVIEERKKEDLSRVQEVEMLRECYINKNCGHPFHDSPEVRRLGDQYFMDLSSTQITEIYLSHYVAYSYCMEKALRDFDADT